MLRLSLTTRHEPTAARRAAAVESRVCARQLGQRRSVLGRVMALSVFFLLSAFSWNSWAQTKLDREGVTLYWGLVPAAVVAKQHDIDQLHGGPPKGGGQVHHLVIALFESATGRRIENAVVRAQLSETGFVDAPAKYVPPMTVDGQMTYGQLFSVAKEGPYQFRVFVKIPDRAREIEYSFSASSPHGKSHD